MFDKLFIAVFNKIRFIIDIYYVIKYFDINILINNNEELFQRLKLIQLSNFESIILLYIFI